MLLMHVVGASNVHSVKDRNASPHTVTDRSRLRFFADKYAVNVYGFLHQSSS